MKRNVLAGAVAGALLSGLPATAAMAQDDQDTLSTLDRVEVTGSRIKRAAIEGALPVTVIDREQLDISGDVTVADFLRNTSFNSFGSFRPQSGSSAQATAGLSLRGLGSGRTLILIDGRRAPQAASAVVSGIQDLNAIPMAAVERIEILSDGASAIYGTDAIGGVVNIITRKDFSGVEVTAGASNPKREGGETEEGSIIFGASNDRASLLAGVSYSNRGIVFARDRPWSAVGVSTFSNNYVSATPTVANPDPTNARHWKPGSTAAQFAVPGGCSGPGFSLGSGAQGQALCLYDFARVAADEAEVRNSAMFARANYQINDEWATYLNSTVSRVESFGRYAPVPATVFIPPNTPNNPSSSPMFLRHRFDSLGNRDNFVDAHVYDVLFGFNGRMGSVDLDFGIRSSESKSINLGRNYLVIPLAEQFIARGDYNIFRPRQNPANVLNGMKTTTARESEFRIEELFLLANMDLFEMGGGMAGLAAGFEYRSEDYADRYDSLSEGGVIGGSSGNSAAGGRSVRAAFAEALFPVLENVEVSLAGRYDEYSDYGSDFSPKLGLRWQPLDTLTVRASYGEGFAAPNLNILTQATSFTAAAVSDPATCAAFGQAANCSIQIEAYRLSNPTLESEGSKQISFGIAMDPTDWLSFTLDFWNIEIENRIAFFSSQELVQRNLTNRPIPPGLGVFRFADGTIDFVNEGYANQGKIDTRGADLNLTTNFTLGDWGSLRNQLNIGYTDSFKQDGAEQIGTNSAPKYRAQLANSWTYGDFGVAWNLSHIDSHENFLGNGQLASWTTHDIVLTWDAPWNAKLSVGVNNATDKDPVLDPSGGCASDGSPRGYCTQLYDGYGRVPFVRYTQRF
ncbi:TonB-dependent receptor plug domain-containing protein [Pseudomarimonas salicorniae]|uniref:TonB-dependent receptor n=1 Tax=Pseudomarimonas salicorniae TaxID=2933270 RepID=A0ABT0GE22_9GAMM|nr:TonB-dependent receptor [Lysobacter sp. CAU 1642]MCK7592805.1 TonB-dependent receptor [Lysobacter sp. CAU 1642]